MVSAPRFDEKLIKEALALCVSRKVYLDVPDEPIDNDNPIPPCDHFAADPDDPDSGDDSEEEEGDEN